MQRQEPAARHLSGAHREPQQDALPLLLAHWPPPPRALQVYKVLQHGVQPLAAKVIPLAHCSAQEGFLKVRVLCCAAMRCCACCTVL